MQYGEEERQIVIKLLEVILVINASLYGVPDSHHVQYTEPLYRRILSVHMLHGSLCITRVINMKFLCDMYVSFPVHL